MLICPTSGLMASLTYSITFHDFSPSISTKVGWRTFTIWSQSTSLTNPHLPFSIHFYSPLIPSLKMPNSPPYISNPQNVFYQNDLWKIMKRWSPQWYLPSFLFCLSHPWPSIWVLLNDCLWEALFLRRLDNLFYWVPDQHPVSLLLISRSLFTHSSVSESYPSYFNTIRQNQDWSPSPGTLFRF